MCGKKLGVILLLLVVLYWPLCSLSPVAEADLQEASRDQLIKIIRIYEDSLIQIETEQKKQEQIWIEKDNLLLKRENLVSREESRQIASEASLIMREKLLQESSLILEQTMKDKFESGMTFGGILGGILGGVAGYGFAQIQ